MTGSGGPLEPEDAMLLLRGQLLLRRQLLLGSNRSPGKKGQPIVGRASDLSKEPGSWNIYVKDLFFLMLANDILKYVKHYESSFIDQSLSPEHT